MSAKDTRYYPIIESLKEKVTQMECASSSLRSKYEDILREYFRLALKPELSEIEEKRMERLLEMGRQDRTLFFLLNEVDELSFNTLGIEVEQKQLDKAYDQILSIQNQDIKEQADTSVDANIENRTQSLKNDKSFNGNQAPFILARLGFLRSSYVAAGVVGLMVGSGILGAGIDQFLLNRRFPENKTILIESSIGPYHNKILINFVANQQSGFDSRISEDRDLYAETNSLRDDSYRYDGSDWADSIFEWGNGINLIGSLEEETSGNSNSVLNQHQISVQEQTVHRDYEGNQIDQSIPDGTFIQESSVIREDLASSVEEEVFRGSDLFYSFENFSLDVEQGGYFASPDDVDNIFNHVAVDGITIDGLNNLTIVNNSSTTRIDSGSVGDVTISGPTIPELLIERQLEANAQTADRPSPQSTANSPQLISSLPASTSPDEESFSPQFSNSFQLHSELANPDLALDEIILFSDNTPQLIQPSSPNIVDQFAQPDFLIGRQSEAAVDTLTASPNAAVPTLISPRPIIIKPTAAPDPSQSVSTISQPSLPTLSPLHTSSAHVASVFEEILTSNQLDSTRFVFSDRFTLHGLPLHSPAFWLPEVSSPGE